MPLSCRVSYFTTDPIPVGRHDCVALMVRVARHNTMRFEPLAMGRSFRNANHVITLTGDAIDLR